MGSYRGWIPTVTGRLSVDIFGDTEYPSQAIASNVTDADYRFVLIYQKRLLLDVLLPFKQYVSKRLFDLEGNFWFVCLARGGNHITVEESPLEGTLYIFHGKEGWRGKPEKQVKKAQLKLDAYNIKYQQGEKSIQTYFSHSFKTLADDLSTQASYSVPFSLQRNGVVTIEAQRQTSRSATAPGITGSELKKKRLEHRVCSQLFFFLRDVGHRHQHHSPTTDTVVDLYHYDGNDTNWRSETLRRLHRKVLEFKRDRREKIYNSALGVLAYIAVFRKISCDELGIKNLAPEIHEKAVRDAINASQNATKNTNQESIRRQDRIRNYMIGFLGFFLSYLGLLRLTKINIKVPAEQVESLKFVARWMLENPVIVLSVVPFVGGVSALMLRLKDPCSFLTIRNIIRGLLCFRQRTVLAIIIPLFLLVASWTVRFVFF